jgi:RNA polymerase sigma-70 factor (family 1)
LKGILQMDIESRNILDELKDGNEKGYKQLFYYYYRKLCLYAESFVNDPALAEDIVQDTFFSIWEKREELNIEVSLKSYLYRAIHNRCIHYLRHLKVLEKQSKYYSLKLREAEILMRIYEDTASSGLYKDELEALVSQSIQSLPEKTREIFILSRENGLKNQEIADKLGLTIKAIEYHISKALENLRIQLKDYLFELLILGYFTYIINN